MKDHEPTQERGPVGGYYMLFQRGVTPAAAWRRFASMFDRMPARTWADGGGRYVGPLTGGEYRRYVCGEFAINGKGGGDA